MRKRFAFLLFAVPLRAFSQNEIQPEGDKLLWAIAILIVLPVVYYFFARKLLKKKVNKSNPLSFVWRKLKVELTKDRKYRPGVLTLRVINKSKQDVDLEPPILLFRKLWSKRKFKLKGINRYQIYPLYLEAGKTHELRIDLSVFYNHDRRLKRFYWAEVTVPDTKGKKYSSGYVTLRKSLFS